jgi:hypothetical protein
VATNKIQYVREIIRLTKALAEEADIVTARHKEYFDNGYGAAGAEEITQADLDAADIDLSVADITATITMMDQYKNFTGNAAVVTGDYLATMNKVRRADG